ncbi:uncharacterized protein [Leptinotarsa decemlineata]|uniref:uncharacterized protein n=1 Tax=Leptinotarsa decemlineata TaxID=7539 RepID=UPI003D305C0E
MVPLLILPLLQVILAFQTTNTLSYPNPIYGTKRYGRSAQAQHRVASYDPYTYQNVHRYPVGYYKLDPYTQTYPESYYYPQQESYPMYYAPARTSKYEIYQAVLPYYYQDVPLPRQAYSGYYDYSDPVVDVQDELLQEAEREEREETQPIGHESYYENDGDNFGDEASVDDINAAFLQNLIMTQMYQDSLENGKKAPADVYGDYDEDYSKVPTELDDVNQQPTRVADDEAVKELKQLQKANRKDQYRNRDSKGSDNHWTQKNQEKKQRRNRQRKQKQEDKRSNVNSNDIPFSPEDVLVYYDRKPVIKVGTTKSPSTTTTGAPERESRGQKEEFQMRPATPVRNPFAGPVLAMMANDGERKRTPSVYDTIKRLLDMEKSMENSQAENAIRPSMKKRIITPEENLTRQLTVLKKAQ